jgi:hypothetical protein
MLWKAESGMECERNEDDGGYELHYNFKDRIFANCSMSIPGTFLFFDIMCLELIVPKP